MNRLTNIAKYIRKDLPKKLLVGGLVCLIGVGAHKLLSTRVKQSGDTFVVSNYDIGKGYTFIYNAEETGWEYMVEERKGYLLFAETGDSSGEGKDKGARAWISFENLGKNHPLNGETLYVEDGQIGEDMLSQVREKYKDKIPYRKVLDKIDKE